MKNIKNLGIKTLEGFTVGNLQRFPSMEWGDEGGLQADVYYKGIKILQVFQEGNGGCAITYTNANYDANQTEIDVQCLRFLQRVDEDYGPNGRFSNLYKDKKIVVEKGKEVAKGLDDDDWERLVVIIESRYDDLKNIKKFLKKDPTVVVCETDWQTRYFGYNAKANLPSNDPEDIRLFKEAVVGAVKKYAAQAYPKEHYTQCTAYLASDVPNLETI